jgi:hypothetical protein
MLPKVDKAALAYCLVRIAVWDRLCRIRGAGQKYWGRAKRSVSGSVTAARVSNPERSATRRSLGRTTQGSRSSYDPHARGHSKRIAARLSSPTSGRFASNAEWKREKQPPGGLRIRIVTRAASGLEGRATDSLPTEWRFQIPHRRVEFWDGRRHPAASFKHSKLSYHQQGCNYGN